MSECAIEHASQSVSQPVSQSVSQSVSHPLKATGNCISLLSSVFYHSILFFNIIHVTH